MAKKIMITGSRDINVEDVNTIEGTLRELIKEESDIEIITGESGGTEDVVADFCDCNSIECVIITGEDWKSILENMINASDEAILFNKNTSEGTTFCKELIESKYPDLKLNVHTL